MTGAGVTAGYHRPERVAVVTVGGAPVSEEPRIYLSTMPNGPVLVLDRPAADIWVSAVALHDPRAVVGALAQAFGAGAAEIHDDVMGFLAELRDTGLLEWREGPRPR